jgi:hypothetical protein
MTSPLDIARAFSGSLFRSNGSSIPGPALQEAHRHSFSNEPELSRSRWAGCFGCCQSYAAQEIEAWSLERDGRRTALCPSCGVDAVLGDATGYPVTDPAWLGEMCRYWFS